MSKSVEEFVSRKLLMLISLFALIAAAEGVTLCKSKDRNEDSRGVYRREYNSNHGLYRNSGKNDQERRNLDEFRSGGYRKEKREYNLMKALMKLDHRQNSNSYRSENLREDYSVLEGLRSEMFEGEGSRRQNFSHHHSTRSAKKEETADTEKGRAMNYGDDGYRGAEDNRFASHGDGY